MILNVPIIPQRCALGPACCRSYREGVFFSGETPPSFTLFKGQMRKAALSVRLEAVGAKMPGFLCQLFTDIIYNTSCPASGDPKVYGMLQTSAMEAKSLVP